MVVTRAIRGVPILVAVLLLAVGLGATVIVTHQHATRRGPVYSVYQFITDGYANRLLPGQSLWMRGTATCGGLHPNACLIEGPIPGSHGSVGLVVGRGSEAPLWTTLRRLAPFAPLVPATAAYPITGRTATYRVMFLGCPDGAACAQGVTEWQLESGGD